MSREPRFGDLRPEDRAAYILKLIARIKADEAKPKGTPNASPDHVRSPA